MFRSPFSRSRVSLSAVFVVRVCRIITSRRVSSRDFNCPVCRFVRVVRVTRVSSIVASRGPLHVSCETSASFPLVRVAYFRVRSRVVLSVSVKGRVGFGGSVTLRWSEVPSQGERHRGNHLLLEHCRVGSPRRRDRCVHGRGPSWTLPIAGLSLAVGSCGFWPLH